MRVRGKQNSRSRAMEAETTACQLRAAFVYDELGGFLINRSTGRQASKSAARYNQVVFRKTLLSEHRVIWCIVTGAWPAYEVDHKDGNPRNNLWSNLREATPQTNSRWARPKAGVTSARGITLRPSGRFRVRIGMGKRGVRMSIGDFATLEDAKKARSDAEARYWSIVPDNRFVPMAFSVGAAR